MLLENLKINNIMAGYYKLFLKKKISNLKISIAELEILKIFKIGLNF